MGWIPSEIIELRFIYCCLLDNNMKSRQTYQQHINSLIGKKKPLEVEAAKEVVGWQRQIDNNVIVKSIAQAIIKQRP